MARQLHVARAVTVVCLFLVIFGGCGGGGSTSALHPAGKVSITAQAVTLTDNAGNPTSRTLSLPAVSATSGQEISLPVTVNDVSGVAGAAVKLNLDKTAFTCADVTPGGWVSPQAQVVKNTTTAAIAVASTSPCAASSSPTAVATFRLRVLPTATAQNATLKLTVVLCDAKGNTLGQMGTSPAGTAHTAQSSNLIGDLMGDGQADIGSAIKILRVVVGIDPQPPAADLWQWDCNGDGSIDVGDATKILRCVVGLDVWPIGEGSPITYEIVDLGTLPGRTNSIGGDINDLGQVVGVSYTSSLSDGHACLYSGGQMTDLGTLPGGTNSVANGINASGQVVGDSDSGTSGGAQHAFLYSGGTMADLGTLSGGDNSSANGINASGQVVGYSASTESGAQHAFLYSGGKMTDLGALPGYPYSEAEGINVSGQVVGYSDSGTSGTFHAFLYSGGKMTDLGTLPGGTNSGALAINATGQVVGLSDSGTSGGARHAFLYSGGKMTDLGTLPGGTNSVANGINASGQVVGYSDTSSGLFHAFLYSNGKMTDLGALPGYTNSYAGRINASGQVGGYGDTSDGDEHLILWQPIEGTSAAPAGAKTSPSTAAVGRRGTGHGTALLGAWGRTFPGVRRPFDRYGWQ